MYLRTVKMNFKLIYTVCVRILFINIAKQFSCLQRYLVIKYWTYSYDLTYFITSMQFTHLLIIQPFGHVFLAHIIQDLDKLFPVCSCTVLCAFMMRYFLVTNHNLAQRALGDGRALTISFSDTRRGIYILIQNDSG